MKINLCFLYLVLGFSLLFSCKSKEGDVAKTDEKVSEKKEELAPVPEGILGNQIINIDKELAKIIARSFTVKANCGRTPDPNFEKCVVFEKSEIEKIIINNPSAKYIGVYFGNYDKDNEKVKNYLEGENPMNQDFSNYLGKYTVVLAIIDKDYKVSSTLLNLGGLCPPDCGVPNPDTDPDNVKNFLHK